MDSRCRVAGGTATGRSELKFKKEKSMALIRSVRPVTRSARTRNYQPAGGSFKVLWKGHFIPSRDKCKAACHVQVLKQTTRRRHLPNMIICGLEPRSNNTRFLSILPHALSNVTRATLQTAYNASIATSTISRQSNASQAQNSRDVIKHIKDLIQVYF